MPEGLSTREIGQQVQSAAHAALNLLFPPRCAGCGHTGTDFCPNCVATLSVVGSIVCAVCGEPLEQAGLCFHCQVNRRSFQRVRSAFRFEGNIRRAVHAFKYEKQLRVVRPLAGQMAKTLQGPGIEGAVLCAVPLHPSRFAERGFNQSEELARHLGEAWHMNCLPGDALQRTRQTQPQVGLDFELRQANVLGAFTVSNASLIKDRVIVLVDDVCTTGATLDACARVLMTSGAHRVDGVTLARQV